MDWMKVLGILGAISLFFHAVEAGCHAAGWTKYEGVFAQLGNFIKGFLGGIKPPTAGGAVACVALMLCSIAYADVTIPGAKSGVLYCPKTNQSIAVNTIKVATIATAIPIDINAGAARTDGVAVAASIDVSTIKAAWLKLPVLDLLNYCNIGVGAAKMSGDKDINYGGYASISWKF